MANIPAALKVESSMIAEERDPHRPQLTGDACDSTMDCAGIGEGVPPRVAGN